VKPGSRQGRKPTKPLRTAGSVDTGMLDDLLGYHLRRAQAAVFGDFMRTMANDRITPGQFGVLTLIDRNPDLNQSALARVLGIERSTMVAVIDRLEGRRLVARLESASDRRSYVLALTERGKSLLAEVKPKVRRHEKRISAGIEPDDVAALIGFLKRIGGAS
jgi:DNA-binding MarR family transcriptional regulator